MADRSKGNFWEKFSKVGIIIVVLYLLCLVLGFSIRLIFFSDEDETSIVPDDNAASAEGTSESAETEETETTAASNENILAITPETTFAAVLEGGTTEVNISMSTTGEATAADLTWSSSDTSVATVDASTGQITGISAGECVVTVSVIGNSSVYADVDVVVRELEEIDGCTYIDGILVVNKTYSVPETYDPGLYDYVEEAFEEMSAAAAAEGLDLYIGSSYRDYAFQEEIYNNYSELYGWELADTFSARPGYSEHQSGLVIDCNTIDDAFGETEESEWLAEHCAEYGFIIRYPEGKEDITGYKYEPWHIRYVGVEVATEMESLGVCLEEYLGIESEYTTDWEG